MVPHRVKDGLVGVNKSVSDGLYLLQITEVTMAEALQARAVMDEKQFRALIARMQALLPENETKTCETKTST